LMTGCGHKTLTLLREPGERLRCRKCHLTLSPDELGARGFCPECYGVDGEKRTDFETLVPTEKEAVKYRCELCGAVIEWKPQH
jgi:predicted RNA-binding Zn-ribbon protein involved in translation (DUF1610 family)